MEASLVMLKKRNRNQNFLSFWLLRGRHGAPKVSRSTPDRVLTFVPSRNSAVLPQFLIGDFKLSIGTRVSVCVCVSFFSIRQPWWSGALCRVYVPPPDVIWNRFHHRTSSQYIYITLESVRLACLDQLHTRSFQMSACSYADLVCCFYPFVACVFAQHASRQ